jgi:hypothetical protein
MGRRRVNGVSKRLKCILYRDRYACLQLYVHIHTYLSICSIMKPTKSLYLEGGEQKGSKEI